MKTKTIYKFSALCLGSIMLTACGGGSGETATVVSDSLDSTNLISESNSTSSKTPTASFVTPTPTGDVTKGLPISVTVNANDSDGFIRNVRLSINGNFIRQENVVPYEWSLPRDTALSSLPVGTHELSAVITDNDGNKTTITKPLKIIPADTPVGNEPTSGNQSPTGTFSSPNPTEEIEKGDPVSITIDALDSDGSISNVRLSINGNFIRQENLRPYEWYPSKDAILNNLPTGSNTLSAVITDNDGAQTTITKTIVVQTNNTPVENTKPSGSFVAPTPTGSLIVGDSMSVRVNADDSDGTVTSVQLSLNNEIVSEDTVAPYNWSAAENTVLANLKAGSYTLSALITDNDNQETVINTTINVSSENIVTGDCQVSGQLKQWHRVAITCDGPDGSESNAKTFTDHRFNVNFKQGGKVFTVPGHFAADGNAANTSATSGNKWRAYFTPSTTGNWNYTTSFREGSNIAVDLNTNSGSPVAITDGLSGTFAVSASDASIPDFRARGLLQHKTNERYQRFAGDNTVFVQAGMGSPENIFGYDEFDDTIKQTGGGCKGILHSFAQHASDWNSGDPSWNNGRGKNLIGLINYISSRNVNSAYIMMNTVKGDGCDAHPWSVYNDSGDIKTFDVSKLDQWEVALSHMTKKGVLIHALTQETENDGLLNGGNLGVERKLYYRELISRFSHHPALQWNLGEENNNSPAQQKSFANYIKSLDPYDHAILLHTFTFAHDKYTPLLGHDTFNGPSFQFSNIPESASGGVYGKTIEWIDKSIEAGRTWITTMSEASGGNGPTPDTDVTSTQRIYWMWASVMGGGSGFEWYLKKNGSLHAYDLAVEDMREFDEHWKQSGYLARFFHSIVQNDLDINLQSLSPNNNAVDGDAWVLSDPGKSYLVFLRKGGNARLKLAGDNSYNVLWFNPRTGESTEGTPVISDQNLGNPPSDINQDWAAVLTAQKSSSNSNLHPDIVKVRTDIALSDIQREPGGNGWKDSYSVGDQCYCSTTFDHNIGPVPSGVNGLTVREICDLIGPGPGSANRPIYNDIQCGNGPANDAGDEDWCPGRVDIGKEGCSQIGPTWKLPNQVSSVSSRTYNKTDGPFKNPLKGWNSGWDGNNNHPESSVGFQYIPWKVFEPSDGSFDYAAVEKIIDREGSKGRHLMLRLYCDWHGDNFESDCPKWLYTDVGVARLQGNNGRYITDFNDERYIAQAHQAIEALADRFDNDPRIYTFQMGLIGYWGEWHTFGSDFGNGGYDLKDSTRISILDRYKSSFSRAKLMVRYPWREPTQSAAGIGFHNDFFVANNGHSDEFDEAVSAGDQWRKNPIGGEVPPRDGNDANSEKIALFQTNKGLDMIQTGHYSTMKAGSYRVIEGDSNYADYLKLHKKMGYNYQIEEAKFSDTISNSQQLEVELNGRNIGVAPMYYNWDVQFALLDSDNTPVATSNAVADLTNIMPSDSFSFTSNLNLSLVNPNTYKLAVRIIQPNAEKVKTSAWKLDPRNTYILFSNDIPNVIGIWDTSTNQLMGGWSILGDVNVE